MLRIDLRSLTQEELLEAKAAVHADLDEAAVNDPRHRRPELIHLFQAIEQALAEEYSARHDIEEQHAIATALGIDEVTGEWLAGA